MEDILITKDNNGGTATLTTTSSQSHYGIPVLRIEGARDVENNDYGPADLIVSIKKNLKITAAQVVAAWGMHRDRTPQERDIARLYLSQWPDGPQISIISAAAALGRKGGLVKSEAKTRAARENSKKAGRPRKEKKI